MANFKDFELKIINPNFNSPVTDLIIELDHLRRKELFGSTHPKIFFQIKELFHIVESIGSARIEGNHTTLAEFVENQIENKKSINEEIREILNMERALDFIEENINKTKINRAFISELHKITVNKLSLEGSKTPGSYRKINPSITGSEHKPPNYLKIDDYMENLFNFINQNDNSKYDLLKTALAHHRFVWIHPFDNGNGRTVRLLTYAMLIKQGFKVNEGRIINPTAVFCIDRNKYYSALEKADSGTEKGLLFWCEYMLKGLKNEIIKIDKLIEYKYLSKIILEPSIKTALDKKIINANESIILNIAAKKQIFQAHDIKKIFPKKNPAEISRWIRKLRERNLLIAESPNSRKYLLSFTNKYLTRIVLQNMDKQGFLPVKNEI